MVKRKQQKQSTRGPKQPKSQQASEDETEVEENYRHKEKKSTTFREVEFGMLVGGPHASRVNYLTIYLHFNEGDHIIWSKYFHRIDLKFY